MFGVKRMRLGAVGLAVGALLVACSLVVGTASARPKATVTVKALTSTGERVAWDAIIANYERAHPNVDIQATYVDNNQLGALLVTQLRSGNGPDLIYTQLGAGILNSVLPLARAGYLTDLSGRPWIKRVDPQAMKLLSVNGKPYAWPLNINIPGLVANVPLMKKMGLHQPTSFADLLKECHQATAQGKSFFLFSAVGSGLPAIQAVIGSEFAEPTSWYDKREKGQVTFAGSKRWHSAFQHIVAMKNAGCFESHPEALTKAGLFAGFSQGAAPFAIVFAPNIPSMQKLNPDLQAVMMPFPGDSAKSTRMIASWGSAISVSSKSKVKKTAIDIVDFFARQGQSELYAKVNQVISPRDFRLGLLPPALKAFAPLYKKKQFVPNFKTSLINADIFSAYADGITSVFTGQQTIDQTLKNMDAAWDEGAAK